MSRVLLMGAPFQVAQREQRSLMDCFNATGRNTGNLLIGNGLVSHLRYSRLEPFNYSMTPAYIEENFDRVAIAATNFLHQNSPHPNFDFSVYSNTLDKISLPVLLVGLGAQSPSAGMDVKGIPRATWRLVKIAAERSASVGVRGAFTAEVLNKHHIRNVRIIGCPSLYTDAADSRRIRRPESLDPTKVVVTGSRNVTAHAGDPPAAVRVERALLGFAIRNGCHFVYQNEQPEIHISQGEEYPVQDRLLQSLSKFFGVSAADFQAYAESRGRTFFSVAEWFEWIRDYEFSLGTRFHGNLAALLNGVPAVVIAHDSRTLELCEFAAIPHVFVSELEEVDPQALYDRADYDLFEERYNKLVHAYAEFLDENGVPHKISWRRDLPQRGHLWAAKAA